ncbi:hypothetical protein ACFVYP_39830 [Kitasatospora sp. NPDC058201]|uniref:hypothetical protein n=1 Tax=unclassified Kitasatospora TaxID=2633591 RepID=UPI00364C2C07
MVAAAAWGTLLHLPWQHLLRVYLARICPTVHHRPNPAAALFHPDPGRTRPAPTEDDIHALFTPGARPHVHIREPALT